MAKQSKTLQLMSMKLCLNEEEKVMSKAAEFERRLQMKSITSNITDTAKVVMCLDLAATMFGVDFDQKIAIRSSGLKTPTYMNSRKTVENVLELNTDQLTVSALCLMLQCSVQDLAERILEEYRKQAKMELDMNLPQYVCMAVYQACRISKIKVPKSKLMGKSQLKSSQWSKLDAEWAKLVDERFANVIKKKRRSAKDAVIGGEEKIEVDEEVAMKKDESEEPEIEPYEDWKRKVLDKAHKNLQRLKQNKVKSTPPSKQRDTPSKQRDTPSKQRDTPSKQKDTPSKQRDTPSKQKDTPSKQNNRNNHKDTPNKQKEAINKENPAPNKQKDTPNKQKEAVNKEKPTPNNHRDLLVNTNSNIDLDMLFSPRKSPRKTPQKFEPYQTPVKHKAVRLLFYV